MLKMKLLIFVTFILMQQAFAHETDKVTKREVNNSTLFYSYICDDEILLDIQEKLKHITDENENLHHKLKLVVDENDKLYFKLQFLVDENDNLRLKLDTLNMITSSINLQLAKFETTITNLTSTISILSTSVTQIESTNSISASSNDQMMEILRNISDSMSSQKSDLKFLLALPTNCAEAIAQNGYKSGIYEINLPEFKLDPFFVYCLVDPEQPSAPWTVIQRRQDGSINFYRTWVEYQKGFGNLDGEFFIGLDKLHALTQSTPHEIWIKLEDFKRNTGSANYSSFLIGDSCEAYALKTLGSFKGDVRDSLSYHVWQKFSTKDVDNDIHAQNCSVYRTGAWWYKGCAYSNLNGQYLGDVIDEKGIYWYDWHENDQSLKYVHMAIRPVYNKEKNINFKHV